MSKESTRRSVSDASFPRLATNARDASSDLESLAAPSPFFHVEKSLRRTAAEDAHSRLSFLTRAREDLGRPLNLDATSRAAVRMSVPMLAELIILVQPSEIDGEWSIVQAIESGDVVALDEFHGANRLPAHLTGAIERALAHGTREDLPPDSTFRSYGGPETISIPLRGRGRTFGVLTCSHEPSGRKFSSADMEMAEVFAMQAASAIDNARRLQEVEAADRRRTESLSVLAHELRNPLAAIRYAVAVLRRFADKEAVRSAHDIIDKQTTHMVRLVDDLSEMSRLTNGKIRLELESLDVATVVHEAVEASRPSIDARAHRLTVRSPHTPVRVVADRVRLSQVLANLLDNAAKYTPPQGAISISADREGEKAVFRVSDNGIGIPAETLPRVFDMFMQVDRSLGLSQGGLGIGLSLVRRFVELHGGSVQAASAGVNCGSEFTIHLPLVADANT